MKRLLGTSRSCADCVPGIALSATPSPIYSRADRQSIGSRKKNEFRESHVSREGQGNQKKECFFLTSMPSCRAEDECSPNDQSFC